ncbi:FAD-dependent monooxygenase [Streptomyces mangrovisoli]|uniref:Pyridine nucleotide-disulfide oxidoreductase n=1 Tax=Streptomyces mangrovisoli TaxID=1428628 RepID=A0A1J4NKS3_9ACTN|nr:FAD-dependent monooxygenase [Streptomyces mangrovisoli]OIJ62762.1 pyridine nucleotide-disulfide oxidoreductase [Streptomyces mangrovisoli]
MSDGLHDRPRSAVVIGGSTTGMLAASVLATRFDEVTVVERDRTPSGAERRKGVPQAQHAHLLWSGGVDALDDILPDITGALVRAGAERIDVMTDLVSKAPSGQWFRRFGHSRHPVITCSRDLLDAVIRGEVLGRPGIKVMDATAVDGLLGTKERVTGVRVSAGDGTAGTLAADLVIDAGGRGSRSGTWLVELGHAPVLERTVDAGVVYASRMYEAPHKTRSMRYPVVNVQADPRSAPGQGGIIVPIEDGRWLVTLSGTRGGEPTADPDAFRTFALTGLKDPIIGELIGRATPLTDPVLSRSTANRRRYYENASSWPEGFAVLGDAVAGYNPVYGHGLSVAAQSVIALRKVLDRHGPLATGNGRRIQQAAAKPVSHAWNLAVGQDSFYPGAAEQPPTALERALSSYVDRAVAAGSENPRALRGLLDVMSLKTSPARLFGPDMLWNIFFGSRKGPLAGPPLSQEEREAAGLT